MKRRSLLGAILGAAAAPASGMSVAQAAGILGVPITAGIGEIAAASSPPTDVGRAAWQMLHMMRVVDGASRDPVTSMRPGIRAMRSWSDTFKSAVHTRERLMIEAAVARLEGDEGLQAKLVSLLTGGGHG